MTVHTLRSHKMNNIFMIILLSLHLCMLTILTIGYYVVNWASITTFIQKLRVNHNRGEDTAIMPAPDTYRPYGYPSNSARPTSIDLGDIPMQLIHHRTTPDLESAPDRQRDGSDTQSERTIRPKPSRERWNAEYEEYFDLFTRLERYVNHFYPQFMDS